MNDTNNATRNIKASLLTLLSCGLLFAIVYFNPLNIFSTASVENEDISNNIPPQDEQQTIVADNSSNTLKQTENIISSTSTDTLNSMVSNAELKEGKIVLSINQGLRGRRITKYPELAGKFVEEGKVSLNVIVDSEGNVSDANIDERNTTTSNVFLRNMAVEKIKEMKMSNSNTSTQSGIVLLNFKFNL